MNSFDDNNIALSCRIYGQLNNLNHLLCIIEIYVIDDGSTFDMYYANKQFWKHEKIDMSTVNRQTVNNNICWMINNIERENNTEGKVKP